MLGFCLCFVVSFVGVVCGLGKALLVIFVFKEFFLGIFVGVHVLKCGDLVIIKNY